MRSTSAPMSASIIAANGPGASPAISTILIPFSGPISVRPLSHLAFGADRWLDRLPRQCRLHHDFALAGGGLDGLDDDERPQQLVIGGAHLDGAADRRRLQASQRRALRADVGR